jgi:hypothetical protein
MNNQEAQLILRVYRPGGQDASDPLVAQALEQAQRDPELQGWFAVEQGLDLCMQSKLRSAMVVPAELKANLLALRKIARPAPRRRLRWLALAATVVLLLGLAGLWLRPGNPAQLDSFRKTMVAYSMQRHQHITFEASDITQIQKWLEGKGIKADFELPSGLRGKPAEGCRVVEWNGHKAALICFVLADGHHLDLFVMDRAAVPSLAGSDLPQYAQTGALLTATWTTGDQVYLLTGGGNKKFLQKLLQQS